MESDIVLMLKRIISFYFLIVCMSLYIIFQIHITNTLFPVVLDKQSFYLHFDPLLVIWFTLYLLYEIHLIQVSFIDKGENQNVIFVQCISLREYLFFVYSLFLFSIYNISFIYHRKLQFTLNIKCFTLFWV